jgi:glucan phosphoethanolaminetransferase (alkaline phosphatase superfamily)
VSRILKYAMRHSKWWRALLPPFTELSYASLLLWFVIKKNKSKKNKKRIMLFFLSWIILFSAFSVLVWLLLKVRYKEENIRESIENVKAKLLTFRRQQLRKMEHKLKSQLKATHLAQIIPLIFQTGFIRCFPA